MPITTRLIQNLDELKTEFPNAFIYLIAKKPTSISIDGAYIKLHCVFSGKQLIYDNEDIKYLNMLHTEVNSTPIEK